MVAFVCSEAFTAMMFHGVTSLRVNSIATEVEVLALAVRLLVTTLRKQLLAIDLLNEENLFSTIQMKYRKCI
jgi:hypothetical protein